MIKKNSIVLLAVLIEIIAGQAIPSAYNANIGNAIVANANIANGIAANGIAANANAAIAAETAAIANGMAYYPGYGTMPSPYANAIPYAPSPYPCEAEIAVVPGNGVPGLNYGLSLSDLSASHGSGLRVQTTSPLSPSGISVQSDNMAIEGPVSVSGQVPFLGVVAVEGPLPAVGQGAVGYGCGNGNIGMVSEGTNEATLASPYASAQYKNGFAGPIANPALGPNPLNCNAMPVAL